jgi:hypothetical protein
MKDSASKKAYDTKYESSPTQVKHREERNLARARLERAGAVRKGSKTDVDHIKPLAAGGSNSPSNTRVISTTENRGWRKGDKGATSYKVKKC